MNADSPTPPSGKKRLFLRSWGCQMNVYDSARMADVLAPLGYAPVDAPEGADMIILNTCHIREKATEKLFSELGRLRLLKQARQAEGGEMVLAVAGCVAQAEGAEITARAPYVDIVLGPQSYHRLPEMVARAGRTGRAVVETEFPTEEKFDFLPEISAPQGVTAFLTIQEGCDKFCSFCVVPYTRGAEYSRSAEAVLAEARKLVGQGAREITLLGQNVNAWHGAEGGLAGLLRALADIPGLDRLRYTTSHPRDMDAALIAAHRDIPAVMPFLHLPVQSGSDRVLEAMNRGHTAEDYLQLVDRLRAARPDLALSTDIIVGHPGETEADHEATMALIRRVGFAQAFSFKYSPRPGTPAAGAPHRVDEATKDRRLQEVQALLRDQQAEFNASLTGQTVPVLFTGPGRQAGQLSGRTPWLQPVHVPGPLSLIGTTAPVFILAGNPNSLSGELAQQEKTAA
ncbi:tRNA (N6-isopentenyl adenosine(37)-C2)-methylthiotransferase MiaB [Sediminicoccus sp. KRV36]|uniref:tRNA (N6-isopentenyl adenosine(37)-C2)-methylthiotransferase MiaB n=1 Tax=Sediminicoccus sp. KRV36 TaxID=3133721 RepID=UPI00200CB9C5|nr:tRNA (N6-isopentenyl adenosine(37)-C2)-methylthiotransferase MiaB [Sediminicoccus rosea]UPY38096.1 tRNA (N6-isopentenyl adenosine(37)-C2)-methylthiotransferase MiaB [Sediminicoccus rosea]